MNNIQTFYTSIVKSGGILVIALMLANVGNFIISAILGRELSFEVFGVYTFENAIYFIINIFFAALASTVIHWVVFLNAKNQSNEAGIAFYNSLIKNAFIISLIFSILWIIISPFVSSFFHLQGILPLLFFTPLFIAGALASINKGFLQGTFLFTLTSIVLLSEVISKIFFVFIFIFFNITEYIYAVIPLSVAFTYLISIIFIFTKTRNTIATNTLKFPKRFYTAAVFSGLSTSAFLSLDVVLVKHFLSPVIAGEYALLALVGKMIFFFGVVFNSLMISYISAEEGSNKSAHSIFMKFFGLTCLLTLTIFIAVGPLGSLIIPILFGHKSQVILQYVTLYGIGISIFTLTNSIISYQLLRHNYLFPVISLFAAGMLLLGISLNHSSILAICDTIVTINVAVFIVIVILHLRQEAFQPLTRAESFVKEDK